MVYTWLKIDRTDFGLKFIFDKCLLVELWHLSVWSMLHAFISVAPWFLFFVVIERLGEAQLAVSNIIRREAASDKEEAIAAPAIPLSRTKTNQ